MAKIFSSELHGNENASIQFNVAITWAVNGVREAIANLADSKKADEYAPGAIHALRKLCAGERDCTGVYRIEVKEWKATFFAWLKRVERQFPDKHAKAFFKNAEEDFRIILEASQDMPEYFWREDVNKRLITIIVDSQAELDAARDIAEKKHPVDLGSALHSYLENCLADLMGKSAKSLTYDDEQDEESTTPLTIRVMQHERGKVSVYLDDFNCFDTPDDVEQDIVTTAYDVEEAMKAYLKEHHKEITRKLRYDSESSMFCVYSRDYEALTLAIGLLIRLATNRELYRRFLRPR